ncbi:MAG TPA: hypothetical protein PK325_00770 [Cyclobacteriaceae bacterium]|nr:hypothetical protein [Cyclobacteriaceae bacterium]HMV07762.1 hypothetical protein [Cyclobacteriaceae bacterium]HMV88030.1 hypothetical protein [Cyclobacteriaceae bacterium]HMW98897.1 hypothetical protein [Cyclobacteriaceae bacterium]HMX48470.1 hypothetical protein [Cyclobacteriaceae bacterium]
MANGIERIQKKIDSFKRRYYLNLLVRGILFTLSILVAYFLTAALLEYVLWLGTWGRLLILIIFFALVVYCGFKFFKDPVAYLVSKRGLNDEQGARLIGDYFPGIKDRLVNLIQLSSVSDSGLAQASILQKSKEFEPVQFESVIRINDNKKYLKYLAIPVGIVLVILFLNKTIITQSTERIVNFNQQYSPQAPFTFNIENKNLVGFFNEDFTLKISLKGEAIPEEAYLVIGNQQLKLENVEPGVFQYTFEKLQQPKSFQLSAAGYYSEGYEITLANRPELTQLAIELQYPKYLQRKNEKLINAGNLEIPEGTLVTWRFNTANASSVAMIFASDSSKISIQSTDNQSFIHSKQFRNPDQYEVFLKNEQSQNKERIFYSVDVIKDLYPQLTINNFRDSVLYKRIILSGITADDYGITQLSLQFHVKDAQQKIVTQRTVNIPVSYNQPQQSFFFNWSLDTLNLKPGQQLEYFLQTWDNDGVNGRKSTRSALYTFFIPDKDQLVTDISKTQSQTESKIEQSAKKAEDFQKQVEDLNQKLKGKQSLDWQDEKKIENLLEQKKKLDQMINQMKEQNKLLEQKKETFTEQDERLREKAEQIQKLMDELLDDETKKLMEELEKLLREKNDPQQLQRTLDKLNQNSKNLEKELERTLELFKQLQFDYKMEQAIADIKEKKEAQEALQKKTEELEKQSDKSGKKESGEKNQKSDPKKEEGKNQEKSGEQSKENQKQSGEQSKENQSGQQSKEEKAQELAKEQQKLNEEFKKTEEKLEELRKLGEELNENGAPEKEKSESVEKSQQESEQNLKQNSPSKAKESQKKAIQQMQQMQQQMEDSQNSMQMEMEMQNLESLRQIIHGLIKISFDQENLIKKFRELEQNDPRFNVLAQQQLKLKDDVKVLEDSLLELSKKDAMMSSFVTREVTELNTRVDKVIEANKERRRQQAATEMQFSMTAINNLALMLDSHFDQMMEMMKNAKPGKGKSKGGKQSLGQMQQQLNKRIEELKGSGKQGRELSEELAEMAAEQERIRRALQEMQEKMKNENGGKLPGGDLTQKMEETETELVNKQLTDKLIERQKEILTRLLESEKSMREQDLDHERKGETAKDHEKEIPPAVEEYLRLKEKEVELLKTVPPKLFPYYKKEVGEYFKRIGGNK